MATAFRFLPIVERISFRYLCERRGIPAGSYGARCLGEHEMREVYVTQISTQRLKIYSHYAWLTEFETDLKGFWLAADET